MAIARTLNVRLLTVNSRPPIRSRSATPATALFPLWTVFLALAVVLCCLLSGLGKLGLVGPDDPRYAFIARAMLQTGDWVTPRLYGQPWFEKPVLYYWAAAAAFRFFGVTEFAARLPCALAALLATLAIAWAALRAYGRDSAVLVMLFLPTSIAIIAFARAATPDALFSALLAACAAVAFATLENPRASVILQIAFGSFLGAATLAKGPAAVILAAGAVFLWALVSRQWRAVLQLMKPASVVSFFVVALPWYILCAVRNPEFLRIFILEHNFARYLTPVFQHPQPFWFFGVVILAATIPWTGLLIPLAIAARRSYVARSWPDSPALFFACWAAFPMLFFSFSESKLPGYILPAVPPLAFLLAADARRYLAHDAHAGAAANPPIARWAIPSAGIARWWILLTVCPFFILPLASGYWLRQLPIESDVTRSLGMPWLLAFTLSGGALAAVLALARHARAALISEAVLMTMLVLSVNARVLPQLDPYLSVRAAARETPLEALRAPGLSVFELNRAWHYGFNFYLDRDLPEWTPETQRPVWTWTNAAGAASLDRRGVHYYVVRHVTSQAWLVCIDP